MGGLAVPQQSQESRDRASADPTRVASRVACQTSGGAGYFGNQTALRRLSRTTPHLQAMLEIGAVNDPLEAEADRVADQVMRMPEPISGNDKPGYFRRKCAACEEEGAGKLHSKSAGIALAETDAPSIVHDVLRSPGQPLDNTSRSFFEPRLGADLSSVRVHNDAKAAQSAKSVNALAYTVGNDIVFGTGRAGCDENRLLLAHELAHVMQQTAQSDRPSLLPDANSQTVRRYHHQDCSEDDLKKHVWPGDGEARKMTDNAITALSASPPSTTLTPLFTKYFMTSTPDVAKILSVFRKVQSKFTANDYTYECEDDCSGTGLGYTWSIWAHIHLCMNHISSFSDACIGRTMVHEFTHRYAGTDDNGYCKSGCTISSCPSSLTPAKALENADSFACFAYELYTSPPAAAPASPPAATPPAPAPTGAGNDPSPVDAGAVAGAPQSDADSLVASRCDEEDKQSLSRKETGSAIGLDGAEAPPIVHEVLNSPGGPLDAATRGLFESKFGEDFSGVRMHTNADAAEAARSVSALAFTSGQHIVFGDAAFDPRTNAGQRLLAHELTHVVQQQPRAPSVQRQPQAVDATAKANEVEQMVRPGNDESGALDKLKALDMADLLNVVDILYNDADSTNADEGKRRTYGLLNGDLTPPVAATTPNPALQNLSDNDRARLKSGFDAAPARKLRNPKGSDKGTSPTVSGYRKTNKGPVRAGDWGEDPADNTWVAHADPAPGIRTYFGTKTPKKMRTSTWLGNNPSNSDYVPSLTKRAIGSFHWGKGAHDFAIYFTVGDASADLRERVRRFSTIGEYIRAHLGDNPSDQNRSPADYITFMKKAAPAVSESDPTSTWTADDSKWNNLVEGFKAAEGWREGTTITAANVNSISSDPADAPLVAYYQNLLGVTPTSP